MAAILDFTHKGMYGVLSGLNTILSLGGLPDMPVGDTKSRKSTSILSEMISFVFSSLNNGHLEFYLQCVFWPHHYVWRIVPENHR